MSKYHEWQAVDASRESHEHGITIGYYLAYHCLIGATKTAGFDERLQEGVTDAAYAVFAASPQSSMDSDPRDGCWPDPSGDLPFDVTQIMAGLATIEEAGCRAGVEGAVAAIRTEYHDVVDNYKIEMEAFQDDPEDEEEPSPDLRDGYVHAFRLLAEAFDVNVGEVP